MHQYASVPPPPPFLPDTQILFTHIETADNCAATVYNDKLAMIAKVNLKPIDPTPRERAAAGNGEMQEWIEYEADVNRQADWMGKGDPDPKYDLANNSATSEDVFLMQLERMWDDYQKSRIATGNTADTEDVASGTQG